MASQEIWNFDETIKKGDLAEVRGRGGLIFEIDNVFVIPYTMLKA